MKWYDTVRLLPWYFRIPLYMVMFASVAALSATVTFLVLGRYVKVVVPDLTGRSLPDAVRMLDNVGLSASVANEVNDYYVPKGYVIEQGTQAGAEVTGKAEISVVLSKGPEVRLIPDVTGVSLSEAEKVLGEEGLVIEKVIRVHSGSIARGRVIAQKPAPEEWTGETITLVASAGRREVIYYNPTFKGMMRGDAALLASELGLRTVFEGAAGHEMVTGQRPGPGEEIETGSTVHLEVGGGT